MTTLPWNRGLYLAAAVLLACRLPAAETELVNADTPWRAFLVTGPRIDREDGKLVWVTVKSGGKKVPFDPAALGDAEQAGFSRLPDAAWAAPAGDVLDWARYPQSDLREFLGEYGVARYQADQRDRSLPVLLCLRTTFGIADPARVTDLNATVTCLGGAVVYVNGKDVGRGFLPQGPLHPLTPAENLPAAAYTMDDGATALPELKMNAEPDPKLLARYQQRVRSFTVKIPRDVLVKGANTLAVQIHRAPVCGSMGRSSWVHLGVRSVTLTSASGGGVIPCAEALKGTRLWSANPEEQIADTLAPASVNRYGLWTIYWMRGRAVRGIRCGNPFDPVAPIRIAAPRNGAGSGLTVVTDLAGLKDVKASLSSLKGPAGELPSGAVEIRYAAHHADMHFCDALLPTPPAGAVTVPVWVKVEAPKTQPPGWYAGTLNVKANGKDFRVPVQVLVTGATLPDPRDFTSLIGAACSPEAVAAHDNVEPWSDAHLRLMEPSLRMAGQLGNDVLNVPVILGAMEPTSRGGRLSSGSAKGPRRLPLVRWVKDGGGVNPDFSLLERFLDVYVKHCGPPKALSLYVWDSGCTTEIANAYENRRIDSVAVAAKTPLLVQQWDPKTGAIAEMPAPQFLDAGAEKFWKPLFDGVRALVVKRGWPDRILLAGLGSDSRPGEKTGEILRQWAPSMRWRILSHFSGDPAPRGGKMIATGKLEVGLKEHPWLDSGLARARTAAELEKAVTDTSEFIDLPTQRWMWTDNSAPVVFRTTPMLSGVLGQVGIDFWPEAIKRGKLPKNSSFFTGSDAMTVPGPNGAEPTVRFQMMREGVQDTELRYMIARAYLKLPEADRKPYQDLLNEFARRVAWSAGYLTQVELGYGWRAYAAKTQAAAAELAGVKSAAKWETPTP
jgi:hypothetical protein